MENKFKDFLYKYNGRFVEKVDASNLNQCLLDHLFDLWYNNDMKKFIINSKKHGAFEVLLDDEDFKVVKAMGKWNIHIVRNMPYVQKRITLYNLVELHRFLLKAKKGEYVDHINGNTLDNRRFNIRICSNGANIRNGKIRLNNKSGYTGVFHTNNDIWISYIKVNYKRIHLGSFKTFEEAVKARKEAEIKYFNI
jgi:hypothetical protein